MSQEISRELSPTVNRGEERGEGCEDEFLNTRCSDDRPLGQVGAKYQNKTRYGVPREGMQRKDPYRDRDLI